MSDSKDLWELGQVKGRQDESERIIKVLAKEAVWWQDFTALDPNGVVAIAFAQAIALIKGGNK